MHFLDWAILIGYLAYVGIDGIRRQAPYGLLNVSAELRAPRLCCGVTVYARNLTNQDYITGAFSTPPPAIGGRPGPSRQIGIELTMRR